MRLIAEIARASSFFFLLFHLVVASLWSQSVAHFQIGQALALQKTGEAVEPGNEAGQWGGTLVISARSEPKTLNPLIAMDTGSREIIGLMTADLVHINRYTQKSEPALATSWSVSADGRRYTMHLGRGIRFSDGQPFDADDVLFSFRSYLDERVQSPQRDLLIIGGKPLSVEKIDNYTVAFTLAQPYAAAERLFDGIVMLPRHLLQQSLEQGILRNVWSLNTRPAQIAGLGPFRLKEYVPGQRIVLERNPYYWKSDREGRQLPYIDQVTSLLAANTDAEAIRFQAGETDMISGLDAANFAVLERAKTKQRFQLHDLGSGLEYNFLFFNQNDLDPGGSTQVHEKQEWFKQVGFRQAVSNAIDRESIIRLVYFGRADPLTTQVTPGNKLWIDRSIVPPLRSLERAREWLRNCGFSWTGSVLTDPHGKQVKFSLTVNAGKPQQVQMATIIQQDLKDLGIEVALEPVEFHTFLERVFSSFRYEAAIIALADGDSDPNSALNVLTSNGTTHVWSLRSHNPPPPWQHQIDQLMQQQLITTNYQDRKRIYDRVQQLVRDNMPFISLVSPHILVGAKDRIGNFHPAILSNYTLWNVERIFLRQ